ncbi:MAG: tetratricopeptide repeat protein [Flavobacteriales bacterium]|nr:tetratricopeptide repeat protein [Flavobacteriales bacterium]
MKKILFLFAAIILAATAFAQPDVTSAFNANEDGKYEDAMLYIEKAMSDPKAIAKEKTWRYRGDIYLNVAKDPVLSKTHPEAIALAVESFRKAMEMDTDNFNYMDNRAKCEQLLILSNNSGIEKYNNNDFLNAAIHFERAIEISTMFEIVDSLSVYNTALCYDKANIKDKAVASYLRCGVIGYNVPEVFLFASQIEQKAGNTAGALKILSDARVLYPREKDLLLEEINIYLHENKFAEAEGNLRTAIEQDPQNELLHFALGTVYENLSKIPEAEKEYKAAIAIKANYFDALFNLGATYFNRGVEQDKQCDEIPPSRSAEYNDCVSKATVEFEKSMPHLEAAHKADPTDKITIRSLKEAYTRLEKTEQASKMKALLGE